MTKRIFIGGMGRSGTTITLAAMSFHPALFAIPIETKFLVEADGFYELARAFDISEYSTAATPVVISRFEDLMRNRVTGLTESSFTEQARLSSDIFDDYHGALDEFLEATLYQQFQSNRTAILNACRQFLSRTFDRIAQISNKQAWVEKTPANFWRIDFLRELYPDCFFIHCLRDPRYILISLMRKTWLPEDPVRAVFLFKSMLEALVLRRRDLLNYRNFFEVRLEELESESSIENCLSTLALGLQIESFSNFAIESILEKINKYHQTKESGLYFSEEQAFMVNQILMPYILELGYPASFPQDLIEPNFSLAVQLAESRV